MLISETHYTDRNYLRIPNYNVYHTNYPNVTAHGGIAILVKNKIKHYQTTFYKTEQIQTTSIVIKGILKSTFLPTKCEESVRSYIFLLATQIDKSFFTIKVLRITK